MSDLGEVQTESVERQQDDADDSGEVAQQAATSTSDDATPPEEPDADDSGEVAQQTATSTSGDATPPGEVGESIDLDAIERDLTDVQTALDRLNDGSYWTDEVTGDELPDEVLASFPLTRTVAGRVAD